MQIVRTDTCEGQAGPPAAGGDDDESGLDCGAFVDGKLELRLQPAADSEKCK